MAADGKAWRWSLDPEPSEYRSQRVRMARRGQKKEKREAAARDALADAAASLQQSPRPAPGRPPRAGMPTKEPTQASKGGWFNNRGA